jgi:hypothetical protein
MRFLAADNNEMAVVGLEYMVDGTTLNIVTTDTAGNFVVLQYDPRSMPRRAAPRSPAQVTHVSPACGAERESLNHKKLLVRADFHVGSNVLSLAQMRMSPPLIDGVRADESVVRTMNLGCGCRSPARSVRSLKCTARGGHSHTGRVRILHHAPGRAHFPTSERAAHANDLFPRARRRSQPAGIQVRRPSPAGRKLTQRSPASVPCVQIIQVVEPRQHARHAQRAGWRLAMAVRPLPRREGDACPVC